MIQLSPATSFTINRILKDHTDSATRYVQAKVYDSDTRAVLATKNLTDNGSRWFSALYKLPYDNVAMRGRFILIITTVYDDSGYTTKSSNYAQESEEYLIQERFNNHAQFGGGGGVDIDYKKVREIIQEELNALPAPERIKFPPPLDLKPFTSLILESVKVVAAKVDGLPKPPAPVNLAPVLEKISGVEKVINARPQFKETDMSPLSKEIKPFLREVSAEVKTTLAAMTKEYMKALTDYLDKAVEEVVAPANEENTKLKSLLVNGLQLNPEKGASKAKRDSFLKNLAAKHGL